MVGLLCSFLFLNTNSVVGFFEVSVGAKSEAVPMTFYAPHCSRNKGDVSYCLDIPRDERYETIDLQ